MEICSYWLFIAKTTCIVYIRKMSYIHINDNVKILFNGQNHFTFKYDLCIRWSKFRHWNEIFQFSFAFSISFMRFTLMILQDLNTKLLISISDQFLFNKYNDKPAQATALYVDIPTNNGVIHVIDHVLSLPQNYPWVWTISTTITTLSHWRPRYINIQNVKFRLWESICAFNAETLLWNESLYLNTL